MGQRSRMRGSFASTGLQRMESATHTRLVSSLRPAGDKRIVGLENGMCHGEHTRRDCDGGRLGAVR